MLKSSQIEQLGLRDQFTQGDEATIRAREPIHFLPCAIYDSDSYNFGRPYYNLRIYGILPHGAKACLFIEDAPIYFDLDTSAIEQNPQWMQTNARLAAMSEAERAAIEDSARTIVLARLKDWQIAKYSGITMVWQFPFHGFTLEKHLFARIYFKSITERHACIEQAYREYPTALAHDDSARTRLPCYYDVLARDFHFASAGWNIIKNYRAKIERAGFIDAPAATIINIRATLSDISASDANLEDRSLIESWDIEVENSSADIPKVGGDYTITTVSLIYAFACKPNNPLARYVLSIYPSRKPREEGAKFIICADECDLLRTRAAIALRMIPDLRIAFNGANFDWLLYNDKVARAGLCEEIGPYFDIAEEHRRADAYKWGFSEQKVKIGADKTHICACVCTFGGTLDIDIMPCMRRIFSREEVRFAESLNRYLEKAFLPPKNDIYFKNMLRMFQRARALASPGVKRECHCSARDSCTFCKNWQPTREIDYSPENPSDSMHEWRYTQKLRDERLTRCCACGARPINEDDIGFVNDYCCIDSVRPIQLLSRLNVLSDAREIATTTFTSLFDAFFRADGKKVVNFIASFANEFEIAIGTHSSRDRPRVHFPGAYVFPPILGLHHRPVTALDFSSLYPSLMLTYNISPETVVMSAESARILTEAGYNLHRIEPFTYLESTATEEDKLSKKVKANEGIQKKSPGGWIVRHSGIMVPKHSADSRPETSKYLEDGSVIHERRALEREHVGIVDYAARFLLDGRKAVRARQGPLIARLGVLYAQCRASKDPVEVNIQTLEAQADKILTGVRVEQGLLNEIQALLVQIRSLESKQKGLKVIVNTFYGQLGSPLSPLYSLLAAAGVTFAGQYNTLRVAKLLRELGYVIVYGDTDSVYTRAPEAIYREIDAKYTTNTVSYPLVQYWGDMVILARADIEKLRVRVSAYLRADNGTTWLNMAYEEVGMPAAFFGKKKYALRPHNKGVTFDARPMVRGLEYIKQGQSQLLRKISADLIERVLALSDNVDVTALVLAKLDEYYQTAGESDMRNFILYKTFRPAKKNVMVLRFVERMHEKARTDARFTPPDPGDKFPYVIVRRERGITVDGHCEKIAVGDKMEYPFALESGGLSLDLEYYLSNTLITALARIAIGDAQFDVKCENAKGEYDDHPRLNLAKKYLENYYSKYRKKGPPITAMASRQKTVAGAFREVIRHMRVKPLDSLVAVLLVNERLHQFAAGEQGDPVSPESYEAITNIICEVARDMGKEHAITEANAIEDYAARLESEFTPSQLSAKYSRESFDANIMNALSLREKNLRVMISSAYVRYVVLIYRSLQVDKLIASIAREAFDNDTRGKAKILPIVREKLVIPPANLETLAQLGDLMRAYNICVSEQRREMEMRKRFANDYVAH